MKNLEQQTNEEAVADRPRTLLAILMFLVGVNRKTLIIQYYEMHVSTWAPQFNKTPLRTNFSDANTALTTLLN
jgi:hypothetical protein